MEFKVYGSEKDETIMLLHGGGLSWWREGTENHASISKDASFNAAEKYTRDKGWIVSWRVFHKSSEIICERASGNDYVQE